MDTNTVKTIQRQGKAFAESIEHTAAEMERLARDVDSLLQQIRLNRLDEAGRERLQLAFEKHQANLRQTAVQLRTDGARVRAALAEKGK